MTKIQNLKTELFDYILQNLNDAEFQDSNLFFKMKRDIQKSDSQVNQNELFKAKEKRLEEKLKQKKSAVEVDQIVRDNEDLQNILNKSKQLQEDKIQQLEQQLRKQFSESIKNNLKI